MGSMTEQLTAMGLDPGILILIMAFFIFIILILLIVVMVKQSGLKKRYEHFMMGSNARSMEEEIKNLFYDIDYLKKQSDENGREIRHIYKRLATVFQKVGLVKYDAFNQMGGKLSFALALLDEKNNGFLMNSVHSSDGSYCYIKEIKDGTCSIELSGDEQRALTQALEQTFSLRTSRKEKEERKAAIQESSKDKTKSRKKKPQYDEDRYEGSEYEDEDPSYDEETYEDENYAEASYEDADYDEEDYEDESYEDESYADEDYGDEDDDYEDDPDLVEAEKLIEGLSKKPGRHRVVEEDYGEEGVISYTTGNRKRRR